MVHKKGLKIAPCHKPVKAPALPRLRRPWQPCATVLAGSQEGLAPLSGRCCPYLIFLPTHSTEASKNLIIFLQLIEILVPVCYNKWFPQNRWCDFAETIKVLRGSCLTYAIKILDVSYHRRGHIFYNFFQYHKKYSFQQFGNNLPIFIRRIKTPGITHKFWYCPKEDGRAMVSPKSGNLWQDWPQSCACDGILKNGYSFEPVCCTKCAKTDVCVQCAVYFVFRLQHRFHEYVICMHNYYPHKQSWCWRALAVCTARPGFCAPVFQSNMPGERRCGGQLPTTTNTAVTCHGQMTTFRPFLPLLHRFVPKIPQWLLPLGALGYMSCLPARTSFLFF